MDGSLNLQTARDSWQPLPLLTRVGHGLDALCHSCQDGNRSVLTQADDISPEFLTATCALLVRLDLDKGKDDAKSDADADAEDEDEDIGEGDIRSSLGFRPPRSLLSLAVRPP